MAVNYSDIKDFEYPLNLFKLINQDIDYVPKCDKDEWMDNLEIVLAHLTPMHNHIIRFRYSYRLSLEKIGSIFLLSREAIRQIESTAIKKLMDTVNLLIIDIGYKRYMSARNIRFGSCEDIYIKNLDISSRSKNSISRATVKPRHDATLGDLLRFLINDECIIDFSRIMKLRSIGDFYYKEIVDMLHNHMIEDGTKINID